MNIRKQSIKYGIVLIAGLILIVVSMLFQLNAFFLGLCTAFLFVSALTFYQLKKYQTDSEYAQQIAISCKDDRMMFPYEKAMVLTAKLTFILLTVLTIILYVFGQTEYGQL